MISVNRSGVKEAALNYTNEQMLDLSTSVEVVMTDLEARGIERSVVAGEMIARGVSGLTGVSINDAREQVSVMFGNIRKQVGAIPTGGNRAMRRAEKAKHRRMS